MSPRSTFLLTLTGVLLAGVPLLLLTSPTNQQENETLSTPSTPEEQIKAHISLKYTGKPESIDLHYGDDGHIHFSAPIPAPCEAAILLPRNAQLHEIEVEMHWQPNSPENAVTLTVEPHGLPARSETQWTGENGSELHTIFSLTW